MMSAEGDLDVTVERIRQYLPDSFRERLEEEYYRVIERLSELENALRDPHFRRRPTAHLALFSDHGVPHVRDVAGTILRLLDRAPGRWIAERDAHRLEFM